MERAAPIYVAGHSGLVGSAIVRELQRQGYRQILVKIHQELDLTDKSAVDEFFTQKRPDYVFLAAARVGGIQANQAYPAEFIYQNLMIQTNVLDAAYRYGVKKLLFLASSCIYPKICPQPIKEEYLLAGLIEPTNEPYAMAKLAGIKMCQAYNRQYGTNFITVIPANVYGINDHFDENGHVAAGLLMKFHEAKIKGQKSVSIWGSGSPKREFFYVDDLAQACLYLMDKYNSDEPINVGKGTETSIAELAHIIRDVVGFPGEIVFDVSKPDGIPRRLLDSSRMNNLGWQAKTELATGLETVYRWYQESSEIYFENKVAVGQASRLSL